MHTLPALPSVYIKKKNKPFLKLFQQSSDRETESETVSDGTPRLVTLAREGIRRRRGEWGGNRQQGGEKNSDESSIFFSFKKSKIKQLGAPPVGALWLQGFYAHTERS